VLQGKDITIVGWGAQILVLQKAVEMAKEQLGVEAELIDLRTLAPWDVETVVNSVKKTGKLVVSHEAPKICGFGAEISATIQVRCVQFACETFLNVFAL